MRLIWEYFSQVYSYREYLKQSVARDLRKRYKRSVLGYLWSMLQPLLMMIILAIVFSNLMAKSRNDYAVFLFTGMLPWRYFSQTSLGCLGTIRANSRLMDQVAVPKYIFPSSTGFSNLVDFLLSLVPLFLVMLAVGSPFHWTILLFPLVLLPLFLFTMGVALLFAVGNVFFEDTQHLSQVVLQALYFLCPVLYERTILPESLIPWVALNPAFCQIEFMRNLFMDGKLPSLETYAINFAGSALFLLLGLWVFKKSEDKFVYFV